MSSKTLKEGFRMLGIFIDNLDYLKSDNIIEDYEVTRIEWDVKGGRGPLVSYNLSPKYKPKRERDVVLNVIEYKQSVALESSKEDL